MRLLDGHWAPSDVTIGAMVRKSRDSPPGQGWATQGRATRGRASQGRPILADPFYYLNNFRAVLSSLEERYGELLSTQERQFITQFAELPKPSCALLVRMIMRHGMFFRLSRLHYPEIGDTAAAVAPLLSIGWLEEPVLQVSELHRLLTKAELISYLALSRELCRLNKPDLLETLRAQYQESRPFHGWCKRSQDRVFHPIVKRLAERFRLMFFGNFHQDWTEFVLADLGIYSYETIPRSEQSAPFRTREHIDSFLELYRGQQELDEGAAPDEIIAGIPLPIADSDWLDDLRQKLLFRVANAYERSENSSAALAVFSTCRYRGSRMRTIRLLERLHEWPAARSLCLAARENPENEAERQQARRLLPRLERKLGIAGGITASNSSGVASFEVLLDTTANDRPVECYVRDYLARQAEAHSTVHYVENGLINSLFGLLCWKAIFAPISGAFFHDFQVGPADLESAQFYERRRAQFAECFAELESGRYKATIRQRFAAKARIQAPFLTWGLLNERLLESALLCFPAPHLQLWFEWIVRDIVENRTGFPDLVQFWPREERYRMVEVKGPGDRLQDNQRRFLEFCTLHHMPVSVCRVRCGSNP